MGQALESVLPLFAPLPTSILLHVLAVYRHPVTARQASTNVPRRSRKKKTNPLEQETGYSVEEWLQLERDLKPIRLKVFRQVDLALRQGMLTTGWLQKALMEVVPTNQRERVARSTVSEWQERGYLEKHPNPHEAALLLIVRELMSFVDPERERYWLPKGRLSLEVEEAILQRQLRHGDSFGEQSVQKSETPLVERIAVQPKGLLRVCWLQHSPIERGQPPPPPLTYVVPPLQVATEKTLRLVGSFWLGELWTTPEQQTEKEFSLHWKRINSKGVVCWQGGGVTFDELSQWIPASEAFATSMGLAPDLVLKLADITLNKIGDTLLSRSISWTSGS